MTILGYTSYVIPAPTFTIICNRTLINSIFILTDAYIYTYKASEIALQRQTMQAEQEIH